MKLTLIFSILVTQIAVAQIQDESKAAFVQFGKGNIGLGTAYGIQPNYKTQFGNYFFYGEFDQAIQLKGVPLKLIGRISDEPYRNGRPSYFRLSYDANINTKGRLASLYKLQDSLSDLKVLQQQALYDLEAKLSYQQFQYQQMTLKQDIPSIPSTELPIDTSFSTPQIAIPTLNGETVSPFEIYNQQNISNPIDAQQAKIDSMLLQVSEVKSNIESIDQQLKETDESIQKITGKYNLGFIDGLRKLDVGLSSLTQSHLSRNAVPIQGLHVAGELRNYFYDVAIGLTLPNQLFSNTVFDQVISNSSNVFNIGNFFNVNSSKFVTSTEIGYGKRNKDAISVQAFYTGRSLNSIVEKEAELKSLATNINGVWTPKKAKQIQLYMTLGYCAGIGDTLATKSEEKWAGYAKINYSFKRNKGSLESAIRYLGKGYQAFSQGVYVNNALHGELVYNQPINSRIGVRILLAQDRFGSQDSTQFLRMTNQGTISSHIRFGKQTVLTTNYTFLVAQVDTVRYNHLVQSSLSTIKSYKRVKLSQQFSAAYASMEGADSNQIISTINYKLRLHWKRPFVGLGLSAEHYDGLSRIQGNNYILQPEIGWNGPQFKCRIGYQYLLSDQFGEDNGVLFSMQFEASKYLTWHVSGQRWIKKDLQFFLPQLTAFQQPWYVRGGLIIHLNVMK